MKSLIQQAYSALLDWMLRAGMVWAVIAIVAFSVTLSVLITAAATAIFQPDTPVQEWLYFSIAAPLLISPIVGVVIMSLAYRLGEAHRALAEMASTDPLTGIGNRRRFFDIAGRDFEIACREGSALSVLLLDIDHFKALNDRYGHAAGDAALTQMAQSCLQRLRQTDLLCRWGGEEFIILLPQTPLAGACMVGEDLRELVAGLDMPGVPDRITISVGVAELGNPAASLDEAIALADSQLYAAKSAGRNRVMPAVAA